MGKRNKKKNDKKTISTKRDRIQYVGLKPHYFPKTKKELIDFDYLDKLSPEELEWLSSFMEEWAGARFNHPYQKHHKGIQAKREIYRSNNSRNRDLYNKWQKYYLEDLLEQEEQFEEFLLDEDNEIY